MSYGEDEENRSPCNYFCMWTYCHGLRHFALTKSAIFWVLWIIIFLINAILAFFSIYGITEQFSAVRTAEWKTYGLIQDAEFPGVTVCRETPGIPEGISDVCKNLGVSALWRNEDPGDKVGSLGQKVKDIWF